MTGPPEFFADRPANSDRAIADGGGARSRDILSVLLRTVRLRGERIFCCTPMSPFAILFDHPGGTVHIIQYGQFDLQLEGQTGAHHYTRGDVVMLPAGQPHTVRKGRRVSPLRPESTEVRGDPAGPGASARWLSGTFSFDDSRAAQLLHGLPPVIELRGAGDQALVWLDVSAHMLVEESSSPTQGSSEMTSRILDLLFIQVLRAWAAGPDAAPGWLTGAMDPVVGDAITAVHANPRYPWTIEKLADNSNLSRSAFADRFARRVGQPPATYIAEVRLATAADLLLATTQSVGVIAREIGYESEAAFSRAFSRRYEMAPSRWRRQSP